MEQIRKLGLCGAAKFLKPAMVMRTSYPADGSVALVANYGTENQQTYSVCLAHDPAPIKPDHVWLKDWSENEGCVDALVKAGLVEVTGNTWPTGFVQAIEAKILKKEFECYQCGALVHYLFNDSRCKDCTKEELDWD